MLQSVAITCPVCRTQVEVMQLDMPGRLRATRTDFYELRDGPSKLLYAMACCAECGYVGSLEDWQQEWMTPHQAKLIRDAVAGLPKPVDHGERFERAATIGAVLQVQDFLQAALWLQASWCAFECLDTEGERYYQLRAVRHFELAFEDYGQVSGDEVFKVAYLLGELNRRIGRKPAMRLWFNIAESSTSCPKWIRDAVIQQRTAPEEWFSTAP